MRRVQRAVACHGEVVDGLAFAAGVAVAVDCTHDEVDARVNTGQGEHRAEVVEDQRVVQPVKVA